MVAPLTPYATLEDLSARWRDMPTDGPTQSTAGTLLGDASYWVRQWFPTETGLIDAGESDGTGAMLLVCAMVKRALINADNDGVRQSTDGMAGMTETRVYSNPDGNLYITDNERTLMQGGSRMRAMSMQMGASGATASPWHYSAIDQPGGNLYPDADLALQFPYIVRGP